MKIIRAPKEKIWIRWGKTGFHPKEERRRKRLKNKSGKKKRNMLVFMQIRVRLRMLIF